MFALCKKYFPVKFRTAVHFIQYFYQTKTHNDDNILFRFGLHGAITLFTFRSTLCLSSWEVVLLSDDRNFHPKFPRLHLCWCTNVYLMYLLCSCFQTNANSPANCSKSTFALFSSGKHYSNRHKSYKDSILRL